MTDKKFWKAVRPFPSNKGTHDNHDIISDENGELIKDNREISEILNDWDHLTVTLFHQSWRPLCHL